MENLQTQQHYRRLKWLVYLLTVVAILGLEFWRHLVLERLMHTWIATLISTSILIVGSYFFFNYVFQIIQRISQEALLETQKRREEAEALYHIGQDIFLQPDPDKKMHSVLAKARDLLRCDFLAWVKAQPPKGLNVGASVGSLLKQGEQYKEIMAAGSLAGEAIAENQALSVNISANHVAGGYTDPVLEGEQLVTALAVPACIRGKVFGALLAGSRTGNSFGRQEQILLSNIANQVAIAFENRALYQQVQKIAVLEERERLAREMHDGLAQTLGYLNLRIKCIQNGLEEGTGVSAEELGEVRSVIQETYNDLRQAIFNLKYEVKSDWDLAQALEQYVRRYQEETPILVNLKGFEDKPRLEGLVELQLFRVLQEALTNIRKHAGARQVELVLEHQEHGIQIVVADDGKGFDLETVPKGPPKHFGIAIMKERLQELGGSLDIITRPGQGTKIVIRVPFTLGKTGG